VTAEASNVVAVPKAAVTLEDPTADEGTVMVVDEASVAHEVKVTVGVKGDDAFEITKGLKGGETIVVEGNYALPDGTKVRAVAAGADDEDDEKKEGDDEGGDEGGGTPEAGGAKSP
jgi:multidrug efflux pump subunit AcrA (membrane-fusion protein)